MPAPRCLKIYCSHCSNLTMKPVSQQCNSFFSSDHHRTLQLHFFSFSFALFINLPTSEEGTCVCPRGHILYVHLLVQLQTLRGIFPSVRTLEPVSICNWTRFIPVCAVRLVRLCIFAWSYLSSMETNRAIWKRGLGHKELATSQDPI